MSKKYIGERYVPKLCGEWDNTKEYEHLCIVLYNGSSYTSKQFVPIGIEISNIDFWVETGNLNGLIDELKKDITQLENDMQTKLETLTLNHNTLRDNVNDLSDNVNKLTTFKKKTINGYSGNWQQGGAMEFSTNGNIGNLYLGAFIPDGFPNRINIGDLDWFPFATIDGNVFNLEESTIPNDSLKRYFLGYGTLYMTRNPSGASAYSSLAPLFVYASYDGTNTILWHILSKDSLTDCTYIRFIGSLSFSMTRTDF